MGTYVLAVMRRTPLLPGLISLGLHAAVVVTLFQLASQPSDAAPASTPIFVGVAEMTPPAEEVPAPEPVLEQPADPALELAEALPQPIDPSAPPVELPRPTETPPEFALPPLEHGTIAIAAPERIVIEAEPEVAPQPVPAPTAPSPVPAHPVTPPTPVRAAPSPPAPPRVRASAKPIRVALRATRVPNLRGYYPPEAQRRGIEGTAMVRMVVSPSGYVTHVELVRSSGYRILDEAALRAARAYRFAPPGISQSRVRAVEFRLTERARRP